MFETEQFQQWEEMRRLRELLSSNCFYNQRIEGAISPPTIYITESPIAQEWEVFLQPNECYRVIFGSPFVKDRLYFRVFLAMILFGWKASQGWPNL
jgi:hypothetical protein